MHQFDEIQQYCNTVCQQIRWQKAKPFIAKEIENHIYDQRDAYMASGQEKQSATQQAILQMGDAVAIGQELDKTHRPKPQFGLIAFTVLFMGIGMITNYFIYISTSVSNGFSIVPYALALGVLLGCYYLDFTFLGKYAKQIYIGFLILFGIGFAFSIEIRGRLFVRLIGNAVALSYLALICPVVYALLVYSLRNKGYWGVLLCGIGYLPLAGMLLFVPTLSGFLLFTLTALLTLCFAIGKGWFRINKKIGFSIVLLPVIFIFSGCLFFVLSSPYFYSRIATYLDPSADSMGKGYLLSLLRSLIANAALIGQGALPKEIADISWLPNIASDYSLAYLVYQFGLIVLIGLVLIFAIFAGLAGYQAIKQKSVLGALLSFSIVSNFLLQTAFYVADTLGFGLVSSFPLPFISYGTTALLINAALIGFLLSIFRTGEIYRDECICTKTNPCFFNYQNGIIMIDLKQIKPKT